MATPSQKKSKRLLKYATESASKRARECRKRELNSTRVSIMKHWDQWHQIKAKNNKKTDEDVAGFLIECYHKTQQKESPLQQTSTPAHPRKVPPLLVTLASSLDSSRTESVASGFGAIISTGPEPLSEETPSLDSIPVKMPKDVSYKPDEEDDESTDSELSISDGEYEPQVNEMTLEEEHMSFLANDEDQESSDEEILPEIASGTAKVTSAEELLLDPVCISFVSSLQNLADNAPRHACRVKGCNTPYKVENSKIGTATYLTWKCPNNHIGFHWSSQPRMKARGVHAGDFLLAVNTLLSGNNHSKIAMFLEFMNLGKMSSTFFSRIQSYYCCPVIGVAWEKILEDTHNKLKDKELILAGDGRNDSPGHSAQYCTYTLITHDTKDIVDMVVVDKRQVDLKSPNMEKFAVKKALARLKPQLKISEVVTDAHTQIAAMMKKEHPDIKHSWDVWHGSKNFGKKVTAVATEKNKKVLAPWTRDIINHFWHCAESSKGSVDAFRNKWLGMLHHITDVHEWALGKCEHGDLEEERDKEWLQAGSPAHDGLREVMMKKRFMNTWTYYVNFRHTGTLESFQNLILMYAAKRFSFTYPAYVARNQLAAMDYTYHKDRVARKTKAGNDVLRRVYSKRSGRWSVVPVKQQKSYVYMTDIQSQIISSCIDDALPMSRKRLMDDQDPRRIRPTIAGVLPAPTKDILAKQISRFPRVSSSLSDD